MQSVWVINGKMKKKNIKQFLIGQIVKTIKSHKVYFPYPNHRKLGIYTPLSKDFFSRGREQQMGYRKGIKLKLIKKAITGDKFNGYWWAETTKKKIVFVDQKDLGIDYASSN